MTAINAQNITLDSYNKGWGYGSNGNAKDIIVDRAVRRSVYSIKIADGSVANNYMILGVAKNGKAFDLGNCHLIPFHAGTVATTAPTYTISLIKGTVNPVTMKAEPVYPSSDNIVLQAVISSGVTLTSKTDIRSPFISLAEAEPFTKAFTGTTAAARAAITTGSPTMTQLVAGVENLYIALEFTSAILANNTNPEVLIKSFITTIETIAS